jgi:hypothetical protein
LIGVRILLTVAGARTMDDGSLDWRDGLSELQAHAQQRSLGRTEAYLECLELIRSVWVQLPDEADFAHLGDGARRAAFEDAVADARSEMLRRMRELRDSIEREAEERRAIAGGHCVGRGAVALGEGAVGYGP